MRSLWLILAFAVTLPAQEPTAPQHPKVSLVLPSGIDSETVQIDYFMTGPFGGTGMYTRPEKNKTSYEIDASAEGRPARNFKVIALLPGCEIVTLDIPIENENAERKLPCKAISPVEFKGQIFPFPITDSPVEVVATYSAYWAHGFFGITDGFVTQFRIGNVVPDSEGTFQINLPDVVGPEWMSDGAFEFILREKSRGNIFTSLVPMDNPRKTHDVKAAHEYPQVVRFAAEEH